MTCGGRRSSVLLHRRQRLAEKLMGQLEDITERVHNGYFVDLFVRASNAVAINMYEKVGRSRQWQHPCRLMTGLLCDCRG